MPLLFYFPFIVWIGVIKFVQDATHDLGELTTAQRLSDMDLHNMRRLEDLDRKRGIAEALLSITCRSISCFDPISLEAEKATKHERDDGDYLQGCWRAVESRTKFQDNVR